MTEIMCLFYRFELPMSQSRVYPFPVERLKSRPFYTDNPNPMTAAMGTIKYM